MQRFTHFSYHALHRLRQRSHLTFEQLARLLDARAYVNLGSKPGIQREHLLFYSAKDDGCFVAIRDMRSGCVVTVLPLDYHSNLAWAVPPSHCDSAKDLAMSKSALCEDLAKLEDRPDAFRVSVLYLDPDNRQKAKSAMSFSASDHDWSTDRLASSPRFIVNVLDAAEEKGVRRCSVFALTIRLGKKGTPVPISIEQREMSL